jgi:chemotaxis protein MotB
MARRRKREEHGNHERWLVSYADFITLLFAFFVVMFAVSQVDDKKMGRFTEAVQEATSIGVFDNNGSSAVLSGKSDKPIALKLATPEPDPVVAKATIRQRLSRSLSAAIDAGRLTLVDGSDGLIVRLRDAAFFESASATMREEVLPDLEAVARTLRELNNDIRIEGHTDAVPIRSNVHRSNWELSAARAAAVLSFFVESSGLEEQRLSVAGYGSQRPLAGNDTLEGRAQNRRVDIVVLDPRDGRVVQAREQGAAAKPEAAAPSADAVQ